LIHVNRIVPARAINGPDDRPRNREPIMRRARYQDEDGERGENPAFWTLILGIVLAAYLATAV
jgi:hypothetical protein